MEQLATKQEYIENVRISNNLDKPLEVVFEPQAEEYHIPPGEYIIVSSKGPIGDSIEVTIATDRCIVWGWSGSAMVVLHNGDIVIDWREMKVPALPIPSLRELGEALWENVTQIDSSSPNTRP